MDYVLGVEEAYLTGGPESRSPLFLFFECVRGRGRAGLAGGGVRGRRVLLLLGAGRWALGGRRAGLGALVPLIQKKGTVLTFSLDLLYHGDILRP